MFLAGNMASVIHAATERHARCPEHGHLIHLNDQTDGAPGAQASTAATPLAARAPAAGASLAMAGIPPVVTPASPDSADHDHDHCDLCPASRKRALPAAGSMLIAWHTAGLRWHATDTEARRSGATLYAVAPKTSPPT